VRDGGEVARLAPTYLPREPHATALYRLVKEHGAEFLRHARESYDGSSPGVTSASSCPLFGVAD
jgi:hypothetical protein